MCGLAGVLSTRPEDAGRLREITEAMSRSIVHRGPDDEGLWLSQSDGVSLGFRRLAIIDLSPLGHQPMTAASGRYVMCFNGEVYNYRPLRAELAAMGHTFKGSSDSEVMLAAFEQWGVSNAVSRFTGMFAIALWDTRDRTIHLIRDRLGKKPLFYFATRDRILFGSELKTLFASGVCTFGLNHSVIPAYLRYLYVPAPHSMLAGVRKVMPGTIISAAIGTLGQTTETVYWSLDGAARKGIAARRDRQDHEVEEEFLALLTDATESRMYADVPLGSLLSGGIDSSLVTAVMQSRATAPLKTFCIGFDESSHDERRYARAIADHLHTDHHEMVVSGQSSLDVVSRLPDMVDEPLADPSVIPTYLVSKLAREFVTVVLTGDGGDELFAGYNRQAMCLRLDGFRCLTPALRALAGAAISGSARSSMLMDRVVGAIWRSETRPRVTAARLAKLAGAVTATDLAARYRFLLSAWNSPDAALGMNIEESDDPILGAIGTLPKAEVLDRILLADQQSYLPDDLLAKVDRMTMAVSLESRAPLLDHRLVEFSWSLPPAFKIRYGRSKWLMRQTLRRFVPDSLIERPKTGFTVPIATWLRGPLRDWAGDMVRDAAASDDSLFKGQALDEAWGALQTGKEQFALQIWTIVQLQAWRSRWKV